MHNVISHNGKTKQAVAGSDLKQLEGRFTAALPSQLVGDALSPIMTVGYNLSGSLFYVSESYAAYFGMTPEKLLGKNMAWCLCSRDIGTVLRSVSSLSVHSPSKAISYGVIRPDGSEARHLWLHMARIADEGEVVCYQAAGLELGPTHAGIEDPESLLHQHMQTFGNTIVGSGESSTRCFAP